MIESHKKFSGEFIWHEISKNFNDYSLELLAIEENLLAAVI